MSVATFQPKWNVSELSRDQREALMVELVKAWYAEAGWMKPCIVRDGDQELGTLIPAWRPALVTTMPHYSEAQLAEMRQRIEEIDRGEADLIDSEDLLNQAAAEFDRMRRGSARP